MQDFHEESNRQIKKLAKFDLNKEQEFRKLPIYDFMEHLLAIHDDEQD